MRLRRWQPADAVLETVATLPAAWADGQYTHAWLVASTTTGLAFAATTDSLGPLGRSFVAAFAQDPTTGDWSYVGSQEEHFAMIAPPLLWEGNVTVFKPTPGDALVQSVAIPLSKLTHDASIPCHVGHGFGHGGHGRWP